MVVASMADLQDLRDIWSIAKANGSWVGHVDAEGALVVPASRVPHLSCVSKGGIPHPCSSWGFAGSKRLSGTFPLGTLPILEKVS